MPSPSQILNKAATSFQRADFWKPGGLHICKSGLRTPFAIKNLLASFLVRAARDPHTCPSPLLPGNEVCLKRSRQKHLSLSRHRKFIAVHRHTNQILQEQRGQGLKPSGDTFFTRMGFKNQLLLARYLQFCKSEQS